MWDEQGTGGDVGRRARTPSFSPALLLGREYAGPGVFYTAAAPRPTEDLPRLVIARLPATTLVYNTTLTFNLRGVPPQLAVPVCTQSPRRPFAHQSNLQAGVETPHPSTASSPWLTIVVAPPSAATTLLLTKKLSLPTHVLLIAARAALASSTLRLHAARPRAHADASMNLALRSLWHLSLCLRVLATDTRQSGQPLAPAKVDVEVDNGTFGYYPVYDYVTEERLNGPKTNFIQWNERCDDGLLYFLTPRGWGITNPGPMILDRHGKLVWAKHFDNKFGGQAYDFMVQEYQGEHFLTFWLGDDRVRGHGSGFYYMVCSTFIKIQGKSKH